MSLLLHFVDPSKLQDQDIFYGHILCGKGIHVAISTNRNDSLRDIFGVWCIANVVKYGLGGYETENRESRTLLP